MKKIVVTTIILLIINSLSAQDSRGISHQAVIRDTNGQVVANSIMSIRLGILQGTSEDTEVYIETHTPVSNENGLITYIIGQGNILSGSFADIDWADGPYFLKTEIDPNGGASYVATSTIQFLSVPYALYAEKASKLLDGTIPGEMLYWNGEEWLAVPPGEHNQALRLCNGVPTWGPCQ